MNENSSLNPVLPDERINVLDALRGFAIFGIFIINIRVFTGYSYMLDEAKSGLLLSGWNSAFDWLHTVFFGGKFYTLFSLLFGIGFAIQFIRASSTDRSFKLHFSRRLFFLLLIGIVHLWGIWFSDILVIYALCGYLLLFFKEFSNRALLWTAFLILLLPGLHAWYLNFAGGGYTNWLYQQLSEAWASVGLPQASEEYDTFQMRDVVEIVQSESWATVFSFNYVGPLLRVYMVALDGRLFKVLAVFVIGLWTGRKLMLHKLHEQTSFLKKIVLVGFAVGLPLNFLYGMDNPTKFTDSSFILVKDAMAPFGYVSLTAAYVASFMLLYLTRLRSLMTSLFNAVGKTALSNYILQSIIGILLFYEVGLGLGEKLGAAHLTLAAVLIFSFQIVMSKMWLNWYRYGPLEWFWRVLTYGRYIKNRKSDREK